MNNILVLGTHASYHIPEHLQHNLLLDERLLKNFSDFATNKLLQTIPQEQKLVCSFSRALGDPNRARDAQDLFRTQDFNNNPIWKTALTKKQQEQLLQEHYDNYHKQIQEKIRQNKPTILLDVHDTGEVLLGLTRKDDTNRPEELPGVCLSNYDNQTSTRRFIEQLKNFFEKELQTTVTINKPYKGGFVTQKYGLNNNIQTIQIECNRTLYMDETTQTIREEDLKKVREAFMRVLKAINDETTV